MTLIYTLETENTILQQVRKSFLVKLLLELYNLIEDEDYISEGYAATFPAGMTVASFHINILNDNDYEKSETFDVDIITSLLPDRVSLGNIRRATVTIIDFGKLLLYEA